MAEPPPPNPAGVEWPTIAVIAAFYGGLGAVLALGSSWPLPVTLVALALLGGWYGSIQHEATHGHPTPWPTLNMVLTNAPLGLVYPFWLYRDLHLIHHRDENLTDPGLDPESRYMASGDWAKAAGWYRLIRRANQTLIGRVMIGPALVIAQVAGHLVRLVQTGRNRAGLARWAVAVVAILVAVGAAGMSIPVFALGFGYGGLSITLIRSFAEHRAPDPLGAGDASVADRSTAIVHSRWFWRLLFLNVNLHVTHHRAPHLPWYRIPRAHTEADDVTAADGAGLHTGYPSLFIRHALRPVDRVEHRGPQSVQPG